MPILTTQGFIGRAELETRGRKVRKPKYKARKRERYLYVLELNDGYYYVGQTVNLDRRIEEHRTGRGARFTKRHGVLRIVYTEHIGKVKSKEAAMLENQLTIQCAMKYGPSNVRGGSYCGESPSAIIRAMTA